MSDLTPAAEALDEDLHLLMHDAFFPSEAVKERVWGAKTGVPRTVEESRVLYRAPIVEAFAASGAATLAEFPERVRKIAYDRDTFKAERDQALATADRYHAELIDVGQDELYVLRKERDAAKAMNTHLVHARDRYKALAEQQSATVAEGAETIGRLQADLAATRKAHAEMTAAHAKAVAALSGGSLAELKASRDSLSARVAELLKENDELRRGIRRLCRILGKAMAGDL